MYGKRDKSRWKSNVNRTNREIGAAQLSTLWDLISRVQSVPAQNNGTHKLPYYLSKLRPISRDKFNLNREISEWCEAKERPGARSHPAKGRQKLLNKHVNQGSATKGPVWFCIEWIPKGKTKTPNCTGTPAMHACMHIHADLFVRAQYRLNDV